MTYSVEVMTESNEFVALYIKLSDLDIARTIEVCEGECNIDVANDDSLVGIEILAPGELKVRLKSAQEHFMDYPIRITDEMINQIIDSVRSSSQAITV